MLVWVAPLVGLIAAFFIDVSLLRFWERRGPFGSLVASLRKWLYPFLMVVSLHVAVQMEGVPPRYEKLLNRGLMTAYVLIISLFVSSFFIHLWTSFATRRGIQVTALSVYILRAAFLLLALLIILDNLGISVTPILTTLGVAGLAVSLALRDTLANLFAGLYITMARQVRPGDVISLSTGEEGTVLDITWRSTLLKDKEGNLILIPNERLSQSVVKNYRRDDGLLVVTLHVPHSVELYRAELLAIDVAQAVLKELYPSDMPEEEVKVRFHTFQDTGVLLDVLIPFKSFQDRALIRHEFIKRFHKVLRENAG
ncbi:mechanosensitive ion channel family protein [Thermocrinis albus]|nr:mechanosensitive ion channel family protein [Thermocrinis albus]